MLHHEALTILRQHILSTGNPDSNSSNNNDMIVPLTAARGRVVATDVKSPINLPMTANSAVDGYAFKYADYINDNTLSLAEGSQHAGAGVRSASSAMSGTRLARGEAKRIFTGAPMPQGADTVVMQEYVKISANKIIIDQPLNRGANCRLAGEDVKQDDILINKGTLVRPQDIAHCASAGISKISVHRKLKIAIASTGDELRSFDDDKGDLVAGQVYDANRIMLIEMLKMLPVTIIDLGIIVDNRQQLTTKIKTAIKSSDIVITSGGASVGDRDYLAGLLATIGEIIVPMLDIKPGRPFKFAMSDNKALFALPGNPVAVMVCFLLYVYPYLLASAGANWAEPARYPLILSGADIISKAGRREFLRAMISGNNPGGNNTGDQHRLTVRKFPVDGSGIISSLRQSDGLIEISEAKTEVSTGDLVDFIPFSAFIV